LDAAVYYANNFQDFKKIVLDFTDTTTKAITDCKDVMQRQELQNNLVIKANYNFVSKTIEYLEKQQLLLEGIFIFGGGNKRLRNVTKMYCQCQICHKRRKKECLGKFKLSLN
jgi:hypothetical protein